jgi:hypothetical protein
MGSTIVLPVRIKVSPFVENGPRTDNAHKKTKPGIKFERVS